MSSLQKSKDWLPILSVGNFPFGFGTEKSQWKQSLQLSRGNFESEYVYPISHAIRTSIIMICGLVREPKETSSVLFGNLPCPGGERTEEQKYEGNK